MRINIGRRGNAKRRAQERMRQAQQKFENSAEMKQYNELKGMASQFGVDPSKLGNFQMGNKQNNYILDQLRSQVNAASLAKAPQRPTMTFGDAAPAALRQPQSPMGATNPAQPTPATPPAQPQQPQGLSLQQFQQQANPAQPRPATPMAPQPQQQQPSAQGFQPNQPQGAQQNNTNQRFQQLRNQFAQPAPQPQQQQPQQAQQQPASQQTQQPAQQQPNPTEEEKKRLGQM